MTIVNTNRNSRTSNKTKYFNMNMNTKEKLITGIYWFTLTSLFLVFIYFALNKQKAEKNTKNIVELRMFL